jgi:hypothetical protein
MAALPPGRNSPNGMGGESGSRPIRVFNVDDDDVPPFGAMEVAGWSPDRRAFFVRRCTLSGRNDLLFNGLNPIPSGLEGQARDDGLIVAAYTPDGAENPAAGSVWGVAAGTWTLSPLYPGFVVRATTTASRSFCVVTRQRANIADFVRVSAGPSGDAEANWCGGFLLTYDPDANDWVDTTPPTPIWFRETGGRTLAASEYATPFETLAGLVSYGAGRPLYAGPVPAAGLTVEALDGAPSYDDVVRLQFDEDDGFVVSQPLAGVARVDIDPALARDCSGCGWVNGLGPLYCLRVSIDGVESDLYLTTDDDRTIWTAADTLEIDDIEYVVSFTRDSPPGLTLTEVGSGATVYAGILDCCGCAFAKFTFYLQDLSPDAADTGDACTNVVTIRVDQADCGYYPNCTAGTAATLGVAVMFTGQIDTATGQTPSQYYHVAVEEGETYCLNFSSAPRYYSTGSGGPLVTIAFYENADCTGAAVGVPSSPPATPDGAYEFTVPAGAACACISFRWGDGVVVGATPTVVRTDFMVSHGACAAAGADVDQDACPSDPIPRTLTATSSAGPVYTLTYCGYLAGRHIWRNLTAGSGYGLSLYIDDAGTCALRFEYVPVPVGQGVGFTFVSIACSPLAIVFTNNNSGDTFTVA